MKFFAMILTTFAVGISAYSAQAQTRDSISPELEVTINQIQMVTTPLVDAINLISEVGGVNIVIDRVSLETEHIDMGRSVTITARNTSVKNLLEKILPKPLVVTVSDQTIIVTSKNRLGTGKPFDLADEKSLLGSGKFAAIQALRFRMPVHFDHAPLEMVLQMVGGFAGKQVEFEGRARRHRFELVSIHRSNATLEETLQSVLGPLGLTYEIERQTIVIKTLVFNGDTVLKPNSVR